MRTPPERNPNQLFNNADSFAISFDEAWRTHRTDRPMDDLSRSDKLDQVLTRLGDHPFARSNPDRVREVAEFRLRLLGL
jgi:hypothetical protein